MIRKETKGVTENAGSFRLKNPDEISRNRNAEKFSHTEGMSLRTKARFAGTARNAASGRGRVRPIEFYFFGFAAVTGSLVPAGDCGREGATSRVPTPVAVAAAVPTPPPAPAPTATPAEAPDLFTSSVRPVLASHCAPCHEPGGKMYDRLPFDDPTVVADHSAGVLRRLKGDDRAAVEQWLATLPAPTPP